MYLVLCFVLYCVCICMGSKQLVSHSVVGVYVFMWLGRHQGMPQSERGGCWGPN